MIAPEADSKATARRHPAESIPHAERELRGRLRFEAFIANLAAGFPRLPASELDDAIGESLRGLVETLDVDRCSISQLSEDGTSRASASTAAPCSPA